MRGCVTENVVRWISAILFACAAIVGTPGACSAEQWPLRPVKIVVAYPAGGTVDVVARIVAQKLSDALGQSFYVENKSGGGGNVGTDYVAKSAPDGYTLLMAVDIQFTVSPNFDDNLPFQVTDFAPVSLAAGFDLILSANPSLQANNLTELTALAKQQPGKINYGSYGPGSTHELVMAQLEQLGDFKLVAVPYRGSGQILPDVLSGRIQLALFGVPPMLPFLRSGQLKALAVGSLTRISALPDVPTIAEQGFPGVEAGNYACLYAPAGTPETIIAALQAETARALSAPDVRERLLPSGITPVGSTPEALAARIERDFLKWKSVLRGVRTQQR
jgi:tripartite-type tricarboxylate transporter receptor subunit TctC